jgi:histidinol-phosphate aminotransferase
MEENLNLDPKDDKILNLGLNDGTYCPQSCIEAIKRFDTRTALRNYTDPDNTPLLEAIAAKDGVGVGNIYIANGSGPLLKQCIPHLIRAAIKSSPRRIARHLMFKSGYPIITPNFTYFKVPMKGMNQGLQVHLIDLSPENDFKLDVAELRKVMDRQEGLVYLANPNNPTGNVLITRSEVEALCRDYPRHIIWIDEAYVQYVDPAVHTPVSDLVPRFPNLVVGRTFSFAYGLAGLRIGYLVTREDLVQTFKGQVTNYRLGTLQEVLGVAAVTDPDHLGFIQRETAAQREWLSAEVTGLGGIQVYPSQVNFILCRFTDERTGEDLAAKLQARGIKIKVLKPMKDQTYAPWFRLTLGVPEENQRLVETMRSVLGA